jgi:hypothetical protein
MVGVLARLVRLAVAGRELGFQARHRRPQLRHEGLLFRLRYACQLG